MPTLPVISNRAGLPEMRLPQVSAADFGAQGYQQIAEVGGVFARIQDTYDKSVAGAAAADLSAQVEGIRKTNNQTIGNPDEFEKTTADQIKAAHDQALAGLPSNRAKMLFSNAVADNLTKAQYGIKYDAFDKKIKIAKDNFAIEEQDLVNAAASENPAVAQEAQKIYSQRLGQLSAEGVLDGTEHLKRIHGFLQKSLTTRLDTIIESDRPEIALAHLKDALSNPNSEYRILDIETRAKIVGKADEKIRKVEAQSEKTHKEVSQVIFDSAYAKANNGMLDKVFLDDALSGNNPHISPEKALQLERVQKNPSTGKYTEAVQAVMDEYDRQDITPASTAKARRGLEAIRGTLTERSDQLQKAFRTIQDDELKARSVVRAEQTFGEREEDRRVREARDKFDIGLGPQIVPNRFTKAFNDYEEKLIAQDIKKGMPVAQALEESRKRKENKYKALPQKTKDINEKMSTGK